MIGENWAIELQFELFLPRGQITLNPIDIWVRWKGDHKGLGIISYMPIWIVGLDIYNIHHGDEDEVAE